MIVDVSGEEGMCRARDTLETSWERAFESTGEMGAGGLCGRLERRMKKSTRRVWMDGWSIWTVCVEDSFCETEETASESSRVACRSLSVCCFVSKESKEGKGGTYVVEWRYRIPQQAFR